MHVALTLPGGLLGPDGTCARRAWLRPLNGSDEEWLHGLAPDTTQAAAVTGLIARCVRRIGPHRVTRAVARRLVVGDRDFLMLKLHQLTFGDVLTLLPICPAPGCGARMDLDLPLSAIPVEDRALQASYRLPACAEPAKDIELRLPNGADQERLAAAKGASATELREMLLDACTLPGDRPPGSSEALNEALNQALNQALIDALEAHSPVVELEVELHCPECGHRFDLDLDISGLLLREVAHRRATFDREIHLLAFHYRWSLGDLFSLTAPRRQRFARLLGDELREQRG